jgi:hypothetical protein
MAGMPMKGRFHTGVTRLHGPGGGWALPLLVLLVLSWGRSYAVDGDPAPPYRGTVFANPNIITKECPSRLLSMGEPSKGTRTFFDRRTGRFSETAVHIFKAKFEAGRQIEICVNGEFTDPGQVRSLARKYAGEIGRLPVCLCERIETVIIHDGKCLFGGGNANVMIHLKQAEEYEKGGFLEEALFHEAVHTSIDEALSGDRKWSSGIASARTFISDYAKAHPAREDAAESLLLYFGMKFRPQVMDKAAMADIRRGLDWRVAYFDSKRLDWRPYPLGASPRRTAAE